MGHLLRMRALAEAGQTEVGFAAASHVPAAVSQTGSWRMAALTPPHSFECRDQRSCFHTSYCSTSTHSPRLLVECLSAPCRRTTTCAHGHDWVDNLHCRSITCFQIDHGFRTALRCSTRDFKIRACVVHLLPLAVVSLKKIAVLASPPHATRQYLEYLL
eukprot:COSAG01_NODE_21529_length_897_cov_445.092732_2_plen_159_part_00